MQVHILIQYQNKDFSFNIRANIMPFSIHLLKKKSNWGFHAQGMKSDMQGNSRVEPSISIQVYFTDIKITF